MVLEKSLCLLFVRFPSPSFPFLPLPIPNHHLHGGLPLLFSLAICIVVFSFFAHCLFPVSVLFFFVILAVTSLDSWTMSTGVLAYGSRAETMSAFFTRFLETYLTPGETLIPGGKGEGGGSVSPWYWICRKPSLRFPFLPFPFLPLPFPSHLLP